VTASTAAGPTGATKFGLNGGLVSGDTVTLIRAAGETVMGGPYAITLDTFAASGNYIYTYNPADFTIKGRAITIVPDALSKMYGNVDPILTYSTLGTFAPGDTAADVVAGALSRAAGENVGGYLIDIGSMGALSNPNYEVTLDGTPWFFSITPRPITVTTVPGQSKTYGDADPGAFRNVIIQGNLAFGDSLTGKNGRQAGENAGSFGTMQNTLSAGGNYALTWKPGSFAITPRALTLRPVGLGKLAGGADPTISFSFLGALALRDTPADVFAGSLGRSPGETPGTYLYTLGTLAALSSPNYSYALAADSPLFNISGLPSDEIPNPPLFVQSLLDTREQFDATRGRNNEDPNNPDNLVLIPFKRKPGRVYYAPTATRSGGSIHISSYDDFGPGGQIPQPRTP
ncbi:MAG: MBG domain-containing protein, partial [Candidatus Methylacidiphilales bacterium]